MKIFERFRKKTEKDKKPDPLELALDNAIKEIKKLKENNEKNHVAVKEIIFCLLDKETPESIKTETQIEKDEELKSYISEILKKYPKFSDISIEIERIIVSKIADEDTENNYKKFANLKEKYQAARNTLLRILKPVYKKQPEETE